MRVARSGAPGFIGSRVLTEVLRHSHQVTAPDRPQSSDAGPAVVASPEAGLDPRRWAALALLAVAQFVVVLDSTIVNIALPSIGRDLHASTATLSWVINAYVLAFGGLLLLGGRLADLLGRRRLFISGLALFGLASLAGGLSRSPAMLITARGVQGLGAAALAPAALSLVTALFPAGAERNRALGIWGAVAGSGSAVGVLLGGVLTSGLGWQSVLFINVPVTLLAILIAPRLLSDSRAWETGGRIDVAGALTGTGATLAIVLALVRAPDAGWTSAQTLGLLALALLLGVLFVVVESRVSQPLVPLSIFRGPNVRSSNLTMVLMGAVVVGTFFILSLYLQQILGYDALKAGLVELPLAGLLVIVAGVAGPASARFGTKPVLLLGLALLAGGLGWLSRIPVNGSFVADVLVPSLLIGAGLGFAFVPLTIGAVLDVDAGGYGLASGLINSSQQVGGALGLAVLTAVAEGVIGRVNAPTLAVVNQGYQTALLVAAGIATLAFLAAAVLTPGRTGSRRHA
ncbi:MAG: MFS transporter [Candidatus Dormibacteraeota bacterium]|nr:MFS transporter [Candidatus Dormibacteraeota bacterium]